MGKEKKNKRDREDEDPADREKRKAGKKAEKVAKMLGYSNDINPFGDSNLLQPFVWGKKVTKDKIEGRKDEGDSEAHRIKLMHDIDRVRKRREERENELEEMERLRSEEQRLRESAQYGDWQQKEEDFILNQTRVRSKIRLTENRQEPIDSIAKNILLIESTATELQNDSLEVTLSNLDVELRDPVILVEGLSKRELNKLGEDVEAYLQFEINKKGSYELFWSSLKTIVASERKKKEKSDDRVVHKSVASDVASLFRGKTDQELDYLQTDIDKTINDGTKGDISYWECMAQEVTLQRARAAIAKTHKELLHKQLALLSQLRSEAKSSRQAIQDDGNKEDSKNNDFKFVNENEAEVDSMARKEAEKGLEDKEEEVIACFFVFCLSLMFLCLSFSIVFCV